MLKQVIHIRIFVIDGFSSRFRYNTGTGLREPDINPNNINNRYYTPTNLQAYFARGNVDLLNKYLFTATFRADASSVFAGDNQWGYFPAVGAAWKIKEESFLKDSKLIQDLKLRIGWGKTGQSNIGQAFPSRLLFQPGSQNSQYLPGVITYSPKDYNPDLTWEKTNSLNLGLDFEFFKNSMLTGSIDLYKRKTVDLLSTVAFPPGGTVATEFLKNIGSMNSDGAEVSLNVKAITTDNFSLSIGGNIAYNINEITDLQGVTVTQDNSSNIGGTGNNLAYNPVGYQPYSAWVFEQVYDAAGQPIVESYKDRNGDGIITNADRYYVGLRPNWTYGFNMNVSYLNWDLTTSFRGQLGGQVYNLKKQQNGYLQSAIPTQSSEYVQNTLNFSNGSANPLFNNFNGNGIFSDYLLEDATFLRCDNISLAYKIAKFVGKSSLRLSGTVNNAFLITKYSGQDPENFNAIDRNFYPRPRTYTLGLSLDF